MGALRRVWAWLLESRRRQVVCVVLLGVLVGMGAYIVWMGRLWTYASDAPSTCVNCHVMEPYYATWWHSTHRERATCNDCHVPHNNILNKYYFKAMDGLRHSYVFTMRGEPQSMQAIPGSQKVIYNNCIRCHGEMNSMMVKTGLVASADVASGKEFVCWDCHRDVPHGGKASLSSTPNALVPFPESPLPAWLRTARSAE